MLTCKLFVTLNYVFPKIHILKTLTLSPLNRTVFGDKVIKMRLSGWVLIQSDCFYIRKIEGTQKDTGCGHQEKRMWRQGRISHVQAKERGLRRTRPQRHLDFSLPAPGLEINFYCLNDSVCGGLWGQACHSHTLFANELTLLLKQSEVKKAAFPRVTLLRQAFALFMISDEVPWGQILKGRCQPHRPCWHRWGSTVRLSLATSQRGLGGGWFHLWIQSTTPCRQGSLSAICLLHGREIHWHREGLSHMFTRNDFSSSGTAEMNYDEHLVQNIFLKLMFMIIPSAFISWVYIRNEQRKNIYLVPNENYY